jgi:hypothetical protein
VCESAWPEVLQDQWASRLEAAAKEGQAREVDLQKRLDATEHDLTAVKVLSSSRGVVKALIGDLPYEEIYMWFHIHMKARGGGPRRGGPGKTSCRNASMPPNTTSRPSRYLAQQEE